MDWQSNGLVLTARSSESSRFVYAFCARLGIWSRKPGFPPRTFSARCGADFPDVEGFEPRKGSARSARGAPAGSGRGPPRGSLGVSPESGGLRKSTLRLRDSEGGGTVKD